MNRKSIIEALSKNSQDYWKIIKEENKRCIDNYKNKVYTDIKKGLKSVIENFNLENIVIGVTGSNGRLESHRSETDLIILSKENISSKLSKEILKELNPLLLEIKTLDQTLSFYSNNPKIVYPTRMIDFLELNGDRCKKCYDDFMEKFAEELVESKRIRDSANEKFKEYLKINSTGKQIWKRNEIEHYNLEQGFFYYDENPENGKYGPKYGPLRTIQFFIAKNILKKPYVLLSQDKQKLKEFYKKLFYIMPRTTVERIDFLSNEVICKEKILDLSENSKNDLKDNYNYFLILYHKLQEMHFINKNLIIIKTESKELKERINSIERIVSQN
ncbi:MAG: hypothetical protein ACP5OZ_00885 [Candidatus Woesearchaeota archaeon]